MAMNMVMSYEEFLDVAKDAVKTILPDAEVSIQKVEKLQGESYLGLSIRPEGQNVAASMDLHGFYEQVQENPKRLAAVMSEFLGEVKGAMDRLPRVDADRFTEYDKVKDKLLMEVVPVGPNAKKLEQIPHKTIEDIAVVYRIDVSGVGHENASALITNQMMDHYGITQEQLHQDAVASQRENRPPTLRNLAEVMEEMSGGFMELEESPLWVAGVEGGVLGAAAVQIPEFMDQAAEKLGGNFFVLPSSIHECLFIRDDGEHDRGMLEDMVRQVNATEVSETDFLSDSVYHYDSEAKVFEKASTFEARVAEQEAVYEAAAPETAKETITALLVEPGKHPRPVEIGTELADLQEAVGGFIEVTYPFVDKVGLIMNEEGKLEGLPWNRAIRDEDGKISDVIAGPFLIAGLTEESFGSLTPEQMAKFEQQFHQPEVFVRMGKGIMALPMPDDGLRFQKEKAVEKTAEKAVPEKKAGTLEKKLKRKGKEESR